MVPGTGIAWLFSRRLAKRGFSAGSIRKISEGIAMVTEAVCLIGVGKILFLDMHMLIYHAHRPILLHKWHLIQVCNAINHQKCR